MEFLRLIYNGLALIGSAVLALVVVGASWQYVEDWRRSSRVSASAPANAAMRDAGARRQAALPPVRTNSPLGLPMGVEEAQARGLLESAKPKLYIAMNGQPVPGARNAWTERHARNQYVLVTDVADFAERPYVSAKWALQLPNGERLALQRHTSADGRRLTYWLLCTAPADSLVVTAIPSVEPTPTRSTKCQ